MIFEPFMLRALMAGVAVALVAGVMGAFVVWRRLAYVGDSLAHSSLLGIAFGLIAGLGTNLGMLLVGLVFIILWLWLQQRKFLASDTVLGILAHTGLSIGMVVLSLLDSPVDIHAYLFGDILTVTPHELYWIYGGGVLILACIIANWSALLLLTIDEGLAMANNLKPFWYQFLLMLLMMLVVVIAIRIVGILLITSMLIIPAAAARRLVRSPEAMAILAAVIGMAAVVIGLAAATVLDIPAGPSMVACLALLFAVLFPLGAVLDHAYQPSNKKHVLQ